MIDVESHERAVELAAYVSSEPGPRGEPMYEWIDVREVRDTSLGSRSGHSMTGLAMAASRPARSQPAAAAVSGTPTTMRTRETTGIRLR